MYFWRLKELCTKLVFWKVFTYCLQYLTNRLSTVERYMTWGTVIDRKYGVITYNFPYFCAVTLFVPARLRFSFLSTLLIQVNTVKCNYKFILRRCDCLQQATCFGTKIPSSVSIYEACPESEDTKVFNIYSIFNLQKRHCEWIACT